MERVWVVYYHDQWDNFTSIVGVYSSAELAAAAVEANRGTLRNGELAPASEEIEGPFAIDTPGLLETVDIKPQIP